MEKKELSCVDCGILNCNKRNSVYPEFCPTAALTEEEARELKERYPDCVVMKE